MTLPIWYALTSAALFAIGFYGAVAGEQILRKVLALNIMGSGVFLLLVALSFRRPAGTADPVPHAMVLTGIVVAVSATALLLALARHIRDRAEDDGPTP